MDDIERENRREGAPTPPKAVARAEKALAAIDADYRCT